MKRALLLALALAAPPLSAQPPQRSVADLPLCTEATDWASYWVTDAADTQDCTTGGAAERVLCRCSDGTWAPVLLRGPQGEPGLAGAQGAQGPPGDPLSVCAAWPVGSVYVSTTATDPGTSLGCGTWSAFGAGRVLIGIDPGQVEFDTAEETGGTKTHTLSIAELPGHTHVVTSQTATTGSATSYEHGALDTSSAENEATEITGSTGGGTAFSKLPPYITCYFWRRTA